MNKIHANALFYIYFIALTYAFATDVKILSEPAAFDAEHPIVSSILLFLTKYGLSGGVLRTYFGSLVAVYAATHIATSIDNGVGLHRPRIPNHRTQNRISTARRKNYQSTLSAHNLFVFN